MLITPPKPTKTCRCCERALRAPPKPTPPALLAHGLSHRPQVFLPPELPLSQEGQALAGLQLLSTSQLIQPRAIEQSGEFGPFFRGWGSTPLAWQGRGSLAAMHIQQNLRLSSAVCTCKVSMCRSRG